MKDFKEFSKEELIGLLNKQSDKNLKTKASLKEITTPAILSDKDTLFLTSAGSILGKPYVEKDSLLSGYILLTDVLIITEYSPLKTVTFNGSCFQLAIDQIIAYTPIDRESFLNQLQPHQ